MRKLILPIILILSVALFLPPKADAQTNTNCHRVFDKEYYSCQTENTKCLNSCVDKGRAAMSLTVDGGKINLECRGSVCDPAMEACKNEVKVNFDSCIDAAKSKKDPSKKTESGSEPALLEFFGVNPYQTWLTVRSFFEATEVLKSGGLGELILHSVGKRSQAEKEAQSPPWWAEEAKKMSLEKPKFFPVAGKEEFSLVSFLDKPAATNQPIDVPEREDIKVYPWNGDSGAAIQSNDWEKIRFKEPVEAGGVTSRIVELEQGQLEVKVKNSNPEENKFGVDAGWLGVTVSRTHFWVLKDNKEKLAIVGVYEGEVEVTTKDGKTIKVTPDGDKPGVVVVTQKLSVAKLALAGLVLAAVIGGVVFFLKRNVLSKKIKKRGR